MAGEATFAIQSIIDNIPLIKSDVYTLVGGGVAALVILFGVGVLVAGAQSMTFGSGGSGGAGSDTDQQRSQKRAVRSYQNYRNDVDAREDRKQNSKDTHSNRRSYFRG